MITIQKLTKVFKDVKAVSDLTLSASDKEIIGLLGPNGAGKTTTLMILSTVLRPTSGTVLFGLVDISRNPQAARNQLGVAFQEPVLDGRLTVEQNLEFHADACHLGRTDKKNRIKEVLTYLDMWDTRKERASNLSGGMKKKIEDAKVFIQKPLIAIFDEPTAYLDVPSRHRVWKRILSLKDEGATVILATNMMDEADNLCDRVAILSKGRLITVGSPSTLKDAIPKGDVVEMELAENAQLVKDRVEMMPFVRQVLILKPSQRLRIYLAQAELRLPEIIELLLRMNVKVRSVVVKEPSLDDVFLYYTGETL